MSPMVLNPSRLVFPGSAGWVATVDALPGIKGYWRLGDTATPWTDRVAGHSFNWAAGVSSLTPGAISDGDPAMAAGTASASITSATWMDTVGSLWVIAWIKTSTTATERHVFSRYTNNTNYAFSIGVSSGNKGIFRVQTSASNNSALSAATLTNGAWHCLIGTYDGANVKLYTDFGTAVSSALSAGTGVKTGQLLRLGSGFVGSPWTSGDGIDEIAFGGSASAGATLTSTDVANLAAAA